MLSSIASARNRSSWACRIASSPSLKPRMPVTWMISANPVIAIALSGARARAFS